MTPEIKQPTDVEEVKIVGGGGDVVGGGGYSFAEYIPKILKNIGKFL